MKKLHIFKEIKIRNIIKIIGIIGFIKFLRGFKKIFFNYIIKKLGYINKNALKDIKWVLVTGATSGLGWKLTELLISQNIGVICLGRNNKKLEKLENFLKKKNYKKYFLIKKDLAEIEDVENEIKNWDVILQNHPEIDLIINNAGISYKNKIEEISYKNFIRFFNTNMITPMIISNCYMKKKINLDKKNLNRKINIILSSSGLSKIPIGFSAFYPYNKHFANNYMLYINNKLQKNNKQNFQNQINFNLNSILLGQIYSNISNMTNIVWNHENDEENKKKLYFGYITSTECAKGVLLQGFREAEVEVLGHPDHFLKFFFVRWWNMKLAGYLLTKKRLWMIKNNVN